jgi:SPX domain protein involved in polyphosphate accumulation
MGDFMNDLTPASKLSAASSAPERREHVYIVNADAAEPFIAGVGRQLAPDPNICQAGDAAHYVTTLYFDSANHDIAHTCARHDDNIKIRAREYCDRTLENEIVTEPLLWFEVKARLGASTRKLRFPIPISEVAAFLEDGLITERVIELQREIWGRTAEQLFEKLSKLCRRAAGPLRPDCVVHYRRRAWEDQDGSTRVTIDTELAFYRPPVDVFSQLRSLSDLVKHTPPVLRADDCVIEVKLAGEQPQWLSELLAARKLERSAAKPFSKFLAASRAVASTVSSIPTALSGDVRHGTLA